MYTSTNKWIKFDTDKYRTYYFNYAINFELKKITPHSSPIPPHHKQFKMEEVAH